MKKVMVVGCPGSGKSTFSRKLHEMTGIPLYHLDLLNWNADRTTVPKAVFLERLQEAIRKEAWIIDGNYGSTMELRLRACDTVFFLDYSLDTCLEGIRIRRGKPRSDLPWIEPENEPDQELLQFVKAYPTEGRVAVLELLRQYPDKQVIVFQTREEADAYLQNGKS